MPPGIGGTGCCRGPAAAGCAEPAADPGPPDAGASTPCKPACMHIRYHWHGRSCDRHRGQNISFAHGVIMAILAVKLGWGANKFTAVQGLRECVWHIAEPALGKQPAAAAAAAGEC